MSVVILARVTAAGIQIQAELLVIQTFRAITDSRFKISLHIHIYIRSQVRRDQGLAASHEISVTRVTAEIGRVRKQDVT